MPTTNRLPWALIAAASMAACSPGCGGEDPLITPDVVDGGQQTDASTTPPDAGDTDAGDEDIDAGDGDVDAGDEDLDAGDEDIDAGDEDLDAGEVDAGEIDAGHVPPTLGRLAVSPESPLLVVNGDTVVVQPFTVSGIYSDGSTEDLTEQAVFSIDDGRLGGFAGGSTFTPGTLLGGASVVRARVGTMSASTGITVKLARSLSDEPPASSSLPPVPDDAETLFGGAVDETYKPQVVYPNDGVMVPPNAGPMEIHFLAKNESTTLFELAFTNGVVDLRVHVRCYLPSGVTAPEGERGCIYTPDEALWTVLAESNRGKQAVQLTVRATDDTGSGTVGVSDPIAIEFSRMDVKGALYWFTTANGTSVMRHDFAAPAPGTPSVALRPANVTQSVSCVGCHAVRPDGKTILAEVNGQNDGRLVLADLSNPDLATSKTPLAQSGAKLSTFQSWSPDGARFVGVYADSGSTNYNLKLFNGLTAAYEGQIDNTGTKTNPANHPDWSPDGQMIAYQSMGKSGNNQRSYMGAINLVTATEDGWSEPATLVPWESGRNRYYPAIAPDSSFLVFNESQCPSGEVHVDCNGDSDPSARLWAVQLTQSDLPVELARANQAGPMDTRSQLTNSFPRWSPFMSRGNKGETSRLMWLTFSSTRNYGLRTTPSATGENDRVSRLWMAAVDPDLVAEGLDPSFAPFVLPFQSFDGSTNHVAQWARYYVSDGCSTLGEGCGEGGSGCCNGLQCVQPDEHPVVACDGAQGCLCQDVPRCGSSFEKCTTASPCCDGLRCLDDLTGEDCQGNSCTCTPPCSGDGEACGGTLACCDGLLCTATESGDECR